MSRERAHAWALALLAGAIGVAEGPAEVAAGVVVLTTALTGRLRGLAPCGVSVGIAAWLLAGGFGRLFFEGSLAGEDRFRPLLALAFVIGRVGLERVPLDALRRAGVALLAGLGANAAVGVGQSVFGPGFASGSPQLFAPGTRDPAASGLFGNRLRLAHAIATLSGYVLAALTGRRRAGALVFALLAVALLRTHAVLAPVAAALALAFELGPGRGRHARWAAALPWLLLVAPALAAWLPEWFAERGASFDLGLRLFFEQPVFGVGHGLFRHEARALVSASFPRTWAIDAHQLALHALAETGLVGALGLLAAISVALARAYTTPNPGPAVVGARVALLVVVVLGVAHYPLHHASTGLVFWVSLGIAASAGRASAPSPSPTTHQS